MNIEKGIEDRRLTFVQFQDALETSHVRERAGYLATSVEATTALAALAIGRPVIAAIAGGAAIGTTAGSLINRKLRNHMQNTYIPQAPTEEDIQRLSDPIEPIDKICV